MIVFRFGMAFAALRVDRVLVHPPFPAAFVANAAHCPGRETAPHPPCMHASSTRSNVRRFAERRHSSEQPRASRRVGSAGS